MKYCLLQFITVCKLPLNCTCTVRVLFNFLLIVVNLYKLYTRSVHSYNASIRHRLIFYGGGGASIKSIPVRVFSAIPFPLFSLVASSYCAVFLSGFPYILENPGN